MKRLRWEPPGERRVPKHPYRDSTLLYAALAVILVAIVAATHGDIGRAVFVAVAVFVVATAWSWRTWRNRLRAEETQKDEPPR